MKRRLVLLAVGFLAVLRPGHSGAGTSAVLIIVNATNPARALSRSQLRPIFQATKKTWQSGDRIDPVNLPEKTDAREAFDQAVLGFSSDETARYWIDRKVRGDGRPPRKISSPSGVLAHVAASPGAIGYVPEGTPGSGVRVVARIVGGRLINP